MLRARLLYWVSGLFFLIGFIFLTFGGLRLLKPTERPLTAEEELIQEQLNHRWRVAEAMGNDFTSWKMPEELKIPQLASGSLRVEYSVDPDLQSDAQKLYERYKPDYSAIFMMDAVTGRVLVMASYQKDTTSEPVEDWVRKATFPAASVFKVVTATAAVDKAGVSPQHKIYFNGGNYTLYRKNVLSDQVNRWTRQVTLKEAFAKSFNTAFGRLSLEQLEPHDLNEYADRFLFNKTIPTDFPVEIGVATFPTEKGFEMTEVASGYNKTTRMSPVQGAMIAASIVNNGHMVVPYVVNALRDEEYETVYEAQQLNSGPIMTHQSAAHLRELMEQTILNGTSRRSFRNMVRSRKFSEIEMGGKTGHLTGDNPRGRTDWFVGYAFDDYNKVAIAAVTVNKKYWTIKSSQLAEMMFRNYFEPHLEARK